MYSSWSLTLINGEQWTLTCSSSSGNVNSFCDTECQWRRQTFLTGGAEEGKE